MRAQRATALPIFLLLLLGGSAVAYAGPLSAPTIVTVTMSDSKITLVPATVSDGTVLFKVTNKGVRARSFSVAGKTTSSLRHGKSAALTVAFARAATYPVVAHAVGGRQLKNVLKVEAPIDVTTKPPTTTSPTATATTPIASGSGCSQPATTTVTLTMTDGKFNFSQTTIPCGTVTFVVTNTGSLSHSLSFTSSGGGPSLPNGPEIAPGQSSRETVTMNAKGGYNWQCGQREDFEDTGESGTLTVV